MPGSRCLQVIGKTLIFLLKQPWSRHPKLINTLFHIAYHKHIPVLTGLRIPPGYACQNRLLQIIGVLILIDHDLSILLLQLSGRLGRIPFPVRITLHQYLQCIMLHITEVHTILSLLLLCKCGAE